MIIDVATLTIEGTCLTGEEPASILELENEKSVRAEGPVSYDLTASVTDGNVVVQGTVQANIELQCVRCAEFFPLAVQEQSFLRVYEDAGYSDEVDLTPDLRESIILRFPIRPLCRTGCRGLCAQCGANLNERKCDCVAPALGGQWDKLDEMKLG